MRIGVFCGIIAATVLVVLAAVYAAAYRHRRGVGLCRRPAVDAGVVGAYNLWPVSPAQMAIAAVRPFGDLLLIAATYTPFIGSEGQRVRDWRCLSASGASRSSAYVLKLPIPAGSTGCRVGIYLAMGWSGMMPTTPGQGAARGGAGLHFGGRPALQFRRDLPRLAAAALPECDLARLCLGSARRAIIPRCSTSC